MNVRSPIAALVYARWALVVMLVISGSIAAAADSARQILDRRRAAEERWQDRSQRLTFTLSDRNGRTQQRELELFERRYSGGELRTLILLQSPGDLKGMSVLAYTFPKAASVQWLYTRAWRRPRGVNPRREEPFIDSDLSYADLEMLAHMAFWQEDDAPSRLVGEESVDGVLCDRIELHPVRSPYPRIVVWVGRTDLVPRRLEFFRAAAGILSALWAPPAAVKIITQTDVRAVDSIPMAFRIDIETPAEGTRTSIAVAKAAVNQSLRDELFREEALEQNSR